MSESVYCTLSVCIFQCDNNIVNYIKLTRP